MANVKIGYHAGVGGNRQGIGDYMKKLDQAGIPFCVKSVDDVGLAKEAANYAKASGVPHNVIMRFSSLPGMPYDLPNLDLPPYDSAVDHWNRWKNKLGDQLALYKDTVWLEITNEIDTHAHGDWLGEFMFEAAKLVLADGYKVLLSGFNAGQPEPEAWLTGGYVKYLQLCEKNPSRAGISLHEGKIGDDMTLPPSTFYPWLIGRFTFLFAACDSAGIKRPPTFITEWAWKFNDMPPLATAMEDIKWLAELVAKYTAVKGVFLWHLEGPDNLPNKLQKTIAPVTDYTLNTTFPDPAPDPPHEPMRVRHTVHLVPQDTTDHEMASLTRHLHPTRSVFSYSHDAVEALMYHSTPDGTINLWDAHRWPDDLHKKFAWLKVNIKDRYFRDIVGNFYLKYYPLENTNPAWSTPTRSFFNSPRSYANGKHEGVDLFSRDRSNNNSNVIAAQSGRIERMTTSGGYGHRIQIRHTGWEPGLVYTTTYAHLASFAPDLTVNQDVQAGAFLGVAGMTGSATGVHLHFHIQRIPTGLRGYAADYVIDPYPYLRDFGLPEPTTSPKYDLLPYFADLSSDRGLLYEVKTEGAGQQRHQTHVRAIEFFHTKGGDGTAKHAEWEQLKYDAQFIYRFTDTSPGLGQYYQLRDSGQDWSKWCPRYMSLNEVYWRNPHVTFYSKQDCKTLNSGNQRSQIKLVGVYKSYTFFTGVTLNDVIQLHWLSDAGALVEKYYYAKAYGLVGWEGAGKRAAISEIHAPGARPDNIRETIACIG